ncbi:hypothetical protein UFVDC4_00097 [Staphylococcus phage vB_SauM-UFV_DC4]|nr:hypothetical protein UFVDC4_00097 [Staphylococcus phage vB_SauM-UFV_DC4]
MLNKIREIKNSRKLEKQRKFQEELKEKERIERSLKEQEERRIAEIKAREKATRAFLEKEGLIKSYFDRSVNVDYQEAKQYLLRNGFNWSDLKRMNNYKIFLEANSLVEYKARKENVKIETIKDVIREKKLLEDQIKAKIHNDYFGSFR